VERKARALFLNAQSVGSGEIYHVILSEIERFLLQVILDETDGNQLRTADLLGINRNTLRKKIRTLGVEVRRSSTSDPTTEVSLQH
jgi:two-component system nitrogen regulation response regulator GlnG